MVLLPVFLLIFKGDDSLAGVGEWIECHPMHPGLVGGFSAGDMQEVAD